MLLASPPPAEHTATATPVAPPVPAASAEVAPPPLSHGPGWQIFDETTATDAIVDAIDGAKLVVNAEFFGIGDAGKGALVTDALVAAARRGVEVNVLADLSSALAPPFGNYLRMRRRIEAAGGHVITTSPVPLSPVARSTPALANVDHRKVVTIDGNVGFVGGMNLLKVTDAYHDSMVELGGVAAARLGSEELDRWKAVGGAISAAHRAAVTAGLQGQPVTPSDPRELRIVANAPDTHRSELTDGYSELIRTARRRIWISTPAISDRKIMAELDAAARRGVDVRIVTPGGKLLGVPLIQWVARAHLANLARDGGTAFEIPEIVHRKAIVADDEVILSSYNLTGRSRAHDHEVGIRTTDPAFVAAVASMLSTDMARATKFDPSTFTGIDARIGAVIAKHFTY
jgi:cardiolipin synthase